MSYGGQTDWLHLERAATSLKLKVEGLGNERGLLRAYGMALAITAYWTRTDKCNVDKIVFDSIEAWKYLAGWVVVL